ncbi:hypothetical protein [Massilia sp. 9I]|uniref:hypothetical protein n=1 Tax=Massilia sp. 9I TaxID=2653152 RepID=UPI0012F3E7FF|nr:hypothetical protein [Massilia sp. 9I]VXB81997.1 hypothetical protein MASSI9I_50405 [Massilia sp. 9I]
MIITGLRRSCRPPAERAGSFARRKAAGQGQRDQGNRREQWAATDFEHGAAFLITKIHGTKPSPHAARITIEFRSYAMLDIAGAWQLLAKAQRFPVAYLETDELFRRLDLDPDTLSWRRLATQADTLRETTLPYAQAADAAQAKGGSLPNAIAEAKRKLAESLGIALEKIEITIRL